MANEIDGDGNVTVYPSERNKNQWIPADVVISKMPPGEYTLRTLLASHVAGPLLYGDDGELQDASEQPTIDFLRDDPALIQLKLYQRAMKKLASQATRSSITTS